MGKKHDILGLDFYDAKNILKSKRILIEEVKISLPPNLKDLEKSNLKPRIIRQSTDEDTYKIVLGYFFEKKLS